MERKDLLIGFSKRLVCAMVSKGLESSRAKAKVKVLKLAEVSGCSIQMARRYAMGNALPEIDIIYKISTWLNVTPGWLLFGEEEYSSSNNNAVHKINISPKILEYILLKSSHLFNTSNTQEVVSFVMDIINDTICIDADEQTILKIIDISINSVNRFHGLHNNDIRTKLQKK